MSTNGTLQKLIEQQDLDREEARALMDSIVSGKLAGSKIAAILTALRIKGETVEEITGFVSSMREKVLRIKPKRNGLVDTCGTGGDAQQTFNISTVTAIVAAAMGIPIAKHGNRAVSSKCGSADLLEELGVKLDLGPESVADLIDEVGIGFLFAPAHHPAMKHVAPVRKEMGIRTVFNLIGPLTNPAGVNRQLIGVYRKDLTETVARVLHALGSEKVFVVHGLEGTDEVSIAGETVVSILDHERIRTATFTPEDAGVNRAPISELQGGTARENAELVLEILNGRPGPRRDAVVLNTAFVAVVADRVKNLEEGAVLARETIDSGRAREVLQNLIDTSQTIGNEDRTP